MSYMWIVGSAEQENRGRQSYILYSDTTGRQRAKARAECTGQEFSVFSLLPATWCWALCLLELRVWV